MSYSNNSNIDLKDLTRKIYKSKLKIMSSSPFFGIIISSIQFFFNNNEKTISTDGKNIYLSPTYFSLLNDKEIDILLMHELMHIILKHPFRKKDRFKNKKDYDLACDIVVNSNIINAFHLNPNEFKIQGRILPSTINGIDGYKYTADEVYNMIASSSKSSNKDNNSIPDTKANILPGKEKKLDDFIFKTDYEGYIYLRQEVGYNYSTISSWDLKKIKYEYNTIFNILKKNNKEFQIEIKYLKRFDSLLIPTYSNNKFNNTSLALNTYYKYSFIPYNIDINTVKNSLGKNNLKNYQLQPLDKKFYNIDSQLKYELERFIQNSHLNPNDILFPILMRNYIATYFIYDINNKNNLDILDFLKYSKRGVCYHFATIYTLVLQLVGYNARFACGYLEQGEKNKENKNTEPHAWTELIIGNSGYILIDPTPVIDYNVKSKSKSEEDIDSHDKWSEEDDEDKMEEIDNKLIDGINTTMQLGYGNLPSFTKVFLQLSNSSKLDWKELLHEFLQIDQKDYNFNPPDNRYSDSDFILPGFNIEEDSDSIKNIAFFVDVSGSMSNEQISECFSEIKSSISSFSNAQGYIGFFDIEVKELIPFDENTKIEDIIPYGRGGTAINTIMKTLKEKLDELPVAIVILTDGGLDFLEVDYFENIPVHWIINNENVNPPYGIVARI